MVEVSIRKKWVAMLVSVFALCLVLAGCAGGGDAAKNYVGDWKLVGMEENGEATSADDIKLMEDMGLSVTMSVKEDKTFSMNVMGEEMSGTWEAKSASEATFTVEGQSVPVTLANGVLTLEESGTKMMFEKGTVSTSSSGAAATSGAAGDGDTSAITGTSTGTATGTDAGTTSAGTSEEAAIPIGQTIADDDICTIEIVDKKADWAGDPGYTVKITNKSDKAITAVSQYGTFSVDGKMVDPVLVETIQPGKYVESFMWFSDDDVASLDQLVNVGHARRVSVCDVATSTQEVALRRRFGAGGRVLAAITCKVTVPASFSRRRAHLVRNPVGNPRCGVAFSPEGAFSQQVRTRPSLRRHFDAGACVLAAITSKVAVPAPLSRRRAHLVRNPVGSLRSGVSPGLFRYRFVPECVTRAGRYTSRRRARYRSKRMRKHLLRRRFGLCPS